MVGGCSDNCRACSVISLRNDSKAMAEKTTLMSAGLFPPARGGALISLAASTAMPKSVPTSRVLDLALDDIHEPWGRSLIESALRLEGRFPPTLFLPQPYSQNLSSCFRIQ